MASGARRLPLQRLAVFEAAARHRGFSAAARELGMTQSAVSHQIAALEDELGLTLFTRVWRGVAPTEAGAHLAAALTRGLGDLAKAIDAARAIAGGHTLTVATDFGFAAFWLLPRLAELRAVMGGVDVRIVTRQEDFDPEAADEDVAIVFGEGPWPRCRSSLLVGEHVTPVASPAFLAEAAIGSMADLVRVPLLHLDAPNRGRWLTWAAYGERIGLAAAAHAPELSFNNYILVVQAAIAGQGLALGWRPLVDDAIARGLLAPAPLPTLATGRGYHLVRPDRPVDPPGAAAFRRWLLGTLGGAAG
jgi:LysR family glycine cleavage system transcriptional activator